MPTSGLIEGTVHKGEREVKRILSLSATLLLAGCASTQYAIQPPAAANAQNASKVIEKPKDVVWDEAVAKLGQRFFVINNLEKSSGLINLSYSGDPEKYVDCGKVTVVNKGPGAKTTTFSGSVADVLYMTAIPVHAYNMPAPAQVRRQMSLDGRINLIFEAIGPTTTRVTAATRYILSRRVGPAGNIMFPSSADTAAFNANEPGVFPANIDGRSLTCVSTGALEKSILDVIN